MQAKQVLHIIIIINKYYKQSILSRLLKITQKRDSFLIHKHEPSIPLSPLSSITLKFIPSIINVYKLRLVSAREEVATCWRVLHVAWSSITTACAAVNLVVRLLVPTPAPAPCPPSDGRAAGSEAGG